MKPLGTERFVTFADDGSEIGASNLPGLRLATSSGHLVTAYPELLRKVAALHYHNPRFGLLFRGQIKDYKVNTRGEQGIHSSLYPSILRSYPGRRREDALDDAFKRLMTAEALLKVRIPDRSVREQQLVRWAVLQHYEVCATPLLDVTYSLQVALSFAISGGDEGFLFVFALPHRTGPLSTSIESMTQVIDLSQVCPPDALRPHFQSGVLVGDYPAVDSRESSHGRRGMLGNNFSCRLLAKFKLTMCGAWQNQGFNETPKQILFPNQEDDWFRQLQTIRAEIDDHAESNTPLQATSLPPGRSR